MTQDERWDIRWREVMEFITVNHRNPSKYIDEERGKYVNWLRHSRKLFNAGLLKVERLDKFEKLLEMTEHYKRVNQYQ